MSKHVLVTGAAGFIGSAVSRELLSRGDRVYGIDNLDTFYDPAIKQARVDALSNQPGFSFQRTDLLDRDSIKALFTEQHFDAVVHLAARAGVRDSMHNPEPYLDANLVGFGNLLDASCKAEVNHFLFASSSSVYGGNTELPWSEDDVLKQPLSLYAATKLAGEMIAGAYATRMPCSGLRYFTVYGPGNRPDMAMYRFATAIHDGHALQLHNAGEMQRDMIYVDDVARGTLQALDYPPQDGQLRIRNLGTGKSCSVLRLVELLEQEFGCRATRESVPMLSVEVPDTLADMSHFKQDYGYLPDTSVEQGVSRFIIWFRKQQDS